jgi:hypothetical protein
MGFELTALVVIKYFEFPNNYWHIFVILTYGTFNVKVSYFRGICRHFGANTGRITLLFLILSAGMFISSTAFLPSSFCMYMTFKNVQNTLLTGYFPKNHAPMEIKVMYIQKLLGRNAVDDINIPALRIRNNRVILPVLAQWHLNIINQPTKPNKLIIYFCW